MKEKLFHGKELNENLSSCILLSDGSHTGIASFAFQKPEVNYVTSYDVELVILNVESKKVKARLSLKNTWQSDAYKINYVEIMNRTYPVKYGSVVFGLTEGWGGSSSVSFYDIKKLSLYEQRGNNIVPILTDLVTHIYQGEGCDVETTRKIKIKPQRINTYVPIYIKERRVGITREEAVCTPAAPRVNFYVLRSRDGKYKVPDPLSPFGDAQ
ncbi:hypothetical protein [Janthinobacterium sp. 17J80-10]|uniref:hypothetical protein n=1 Tax=Janthinobacterium sp. 17J80-10 TaxID=2497863 RepID=UPI00100590AC|nr:hypothetical protein [Janthinobacterium sp. 17J80-10]QAU35689.1 hypothetical protein EKL02_16795 [Janthinobacterium sp. 17J80-10]